MDLFVRVASEFEVVVVEEEEQQDSSLQERDRDDPCVSGAGATSGGGGGGGEGGVGEGGGVIGGGGWALSLAECPWLAVHGTKDRVRHFNREGGTQGGGGEATQREGQGQRGGKMRGENRGGLGGRETAVFWHRLPCIYASGRTLASPPPTISLSRARSLSAAFNTTWCFRG